MIYNINRRVRVRLYTVEVISFILEYRMPCRIGPFTFYRWVHVRETGADPDGPLITVEEVAAGLYQAHLNSPSRKDSRQMRRQFFHYKREFNHKQV